MALCQEVTYLMRGRNLEKLYSVEQSLSEKLLENNFFSKEEHFFNIVGTGVSQLSRNFSAETYIPGSVFHGKSRNCVAVRSQADGSCLYSSVSLSLVGNNKLISILRVLTSIELFLFSEFYYNHPILEKIFESKKFEKHDSIISLCVSHKALDSGKRKKSLIEEEAILGCSDKSWSNFFQMLALSSVIKRKIRVHYPDHGDSRSKAIFDQEIKPRTNILSCYCVNILCCYEGVLPKEDFRHNHYVPLAFIGRKKCSSSLPETLSKTKKSKKEPTGISSSPCSDKNPKLSLLLPDNPLSCKKIKMDPTKISVPSVQTKISFLSPKTDPRTSVANRTISKKSTSTKQLKRVVPISNFFSASTSSKKASLSTNSSILQKPSSVPSSSSSTVSDLITEANTSQASAVSSSIFSSNPMNPLISSSSSTSLPDNQSPTNFIPSETNKIHLHTSNSLVQNQFKKVSPENSEYDNDISLFVNKDISSLDPKELYNLIQNIYTPDKNFNYDTFLFGEKDKRKFQYKWLQEFSWLRFSPLTKGAFCLPCVLFGKRFKNKSGRVSKLFLEPYTHWPSARQYFKKHENPKNKGIHYETSLFLMTFLNQQSGKSRPINELVDTQFRKQVAENRKRLVPIIDTLMLCGRTGIASRGHRDESKYHPPIGEYSKVAGVGNFVELLNFAVRRGDVDLKNHLETCSKNATYLSKTAQNELFQNSRKT